MTSSQPPIPPPALLPDQDLLPDHDSVEENLTGKERGEATDVEDGEPVGAADRDEDVRRTGGDPDAA